MNTLIKKHMIWVLILPLSYLLLNFGTSKLITPELWVGWLPDFFSGLLLSSKQWMVLFGGVETILGIGILFPAVRRYASALSFLHLLTIAMVIGLSTELGIRDLTLSSIALFIFISDTYTK